MRENDWGIGAMTLVGVLFWLVALRPGFMRGPMEVVQSFLEHVLR